MKKTFLLAAMLTASCFSLQAQNYTITWPSVADGQAKGWAAHSWSADGSYVIPANTVIEENDYLKVSVPVDSPVFGVWSTYEETYPLYMYWGSNKEQDKNSYYDDIYNAAGIARADHGMVQIDAKQSGRMTVSYSMGNNLRSFYVYQMPTEEEMNNGVYGYYVMCSTTNAGGIHTSAFNVRADRTYLLIASNSGNQLYQMTYSAPDPTTGYTATDLPAEPYTVTTFPSTEDALANGYEAHSWGEGYVYPANTVIADNDDMTLTNMLTCGVFPPSWFHDVASDTDYPSYMYFGSALDNNNKDDIYSVDGIARAEHGIVSLKAKKSGRVILSYSMGGNNRTCYVWRVGTQEEIDNGIYGGYVLTNFTDAKGIHSPAFDVMEGNEYYIIGSGSGNQLYAIGFANTDVQSGTTSINGVTDNASAAVNDGRIYSIDGRYVGKDKNSLGKGLYIMNGKKFAVK